MYFRSISVVNSHGKRCWNKLAKVFQLDACHGKGGQGDIYTHFTLSGNSSNKNIVNLMYAVVCGNEDKKTWMKVITLSHSILYIAYVYLIWPILYIQGIYHTSCTLVDAHKWVRLGFG